jgi:prevent-host-death family protein
VIPHIIAAAADAVDCFQQRGYQTRVIGGPAVQRWGEPRLTRDADLTVLTRFTGVDAVPFYSHKILVMALRRRTRTAKAGLSPAGGPVAAADFKARCLELIDRVRETGVEYVVTKHGVPFAKLVPYNDAERSSFFGSMKGTVLGYERPLDPLDDEYDLDRE